MDLGLAKQDPEINAIVGAIDRHGMPSGIVYSIANMAKASLPPGQKITGDFIHYVQSLVDKAHEEWIATHPHEFDANAKLAAAGAGTAAANGAAGSTTAGSFLKDNFVDAMFDSDVDYLAGLAGFNCHNKHDRAIIKDAIKSSKQAAQLLAPTDPALQQSLGQFIFSGAAAIAKGVISKLKEGVKIIADAIKHLSPEQRKQFDEALKKGKISGDMSEAKGVLYDNDHTGKLPAHMSREEFVNHMHEHGGAYYHNKNFDRAFTGQQPTLPPKPRMPQYRVALSPDLPTDKPPLTVAANNVAASAATLNNPASKYAALTHAPGMTMNA